MNSQEVNIDHKSVRVGGWRCSLSEVLRIYANCRSAHGRIPSTRVRRPFLLMNLERTSYRIRLRIMLVRTNFIYLISACMKEVYVTSKDNTEGIEFGCIFPKAWNSIPSTSWSGHGLEMGNYVIITSLVKQNWSSVDCGFLWIRWNAIPPGAVILQICPLPFSFLRISMITSRRNSMDCSEWVELTFYLIYGELFH